MAMPKLPIISGALALSFIAVANAEAITISEQDIDAIGRVIYAEAGNQGPVGQVAVLDTILNRVRDLHFAADIQGVISQPGQFEPVMKARGWRNLPKAPDELTDKLCDWLQLKSAGVLGDPTYGALYFQNESEVTRRAARGQVRSSLVGFNGMPVTAKIQDHTFYRPSQMTKPVTKKLRKELTDPFISDEKTLLGEETTSVESAL